MINLRKMAEDEVVFRFESDEDRREFLEFTELTQMVSLSDVNCVIVNKDNTFTLYSSYLINLADIPTWTEIKERYRMNIKRDPKGFIMTMDTLNQAIALLQSNGYKVEAPYQEPTDEEIIARVKFENEKVGYMADWNSTAYKKYYIFYSHVDNKYCRDYVLSSRCLGEVYTNQQIAEQIVTELNEKRFVRV